MPKRTWTQEEIDFIVENHMDMTYDQLAEALGKTKKSVSAKICRIRKKYNLEEKASGSSIRYGKEILEFVEANCRNMSRKQMVEETGVSLTTINNAITKLGLESIKHPEYHTEVVISYKTLSGSTGSKKFDVNEKSYNKACARVLHLAKTMLKYKDVEVIR